MKLKQNILPILFLSLVAMLLALPSLHYGYLLEDYKYLRSYDLEEIVETFYSHWEPSLIETRGYRPLHSVHQALFYWLLGGDPFRHRLLQAAISISGVLLIYAFALRCAGNRSVAFWTALVYSCLGAGAWKISFLSTRQHLVQLNLILLTLFFFDRYLSDRRVRRWSIAFICFLLALLLKEEVVTFPLVLAAYALLVKKETVRTLFRPLLPFFLLVVLFISIRAGILRAIPGDYLHPPPFSLAPERLLHNYGHSLLSTLVQTYGVHDPANWDFPMYGGGLSIPRDYIGFFSLLGFFILGTVTLYRRGTAPEKKAFGFGLAVLLIGTILVSIWYRNDRFFISSIGVAFMVGTTASCSFRCPAWNNRYPLRLTIAVLTLIFFFSYLTVNLISFYDIQSALHPYGARALIWDRWVYEEYLPWMKEEQIRIFEAKLRRTGKEKCADSIRRWQKSKNRPGGRKCWVPARSPNTGTGNPNRPP